MTATLDTPSEAAILAKNDLCYESILEACDLAASYARSAAEAAWRADHSTLRAHLLQLRSTAVSALQTFNEITPARELASAVAT